MSEAIWTTRILGNESVAAICSGGTPSRSRPDYFGGRIKWVKSGDLNDARLTSTEEHITDRGLEDSAAKLLPSGTVLIALYGATVGKTALLNTEAATNQAVCAIRPNSEVFIPQFLQFMLMHIRPQLLRERSGGAQPNISQAIIRSLELPCPPQREQQHIAAVLWKAQHAVEVEEKLIATARELKQSAMRQLFTRGLRGEPQKETDYGALPNSWLTQPLGECCVVQTGVAKGRKIPPNEAVEVPYLRVANVQDGHLDLSEMKNITLRKAEVPRFLLQEGDVVLTEGGDFDKLGRGFIWHSQVPNCVHQNHVFAVRANGDVLLPDFLAYLAQSSYGRSYFLTVAHKTTNLACINTTKLKALPVPLPTLDEQREIVAILQTIDRKISVHERKRATLQELFKTLLHQLMTGQIRVHNLDIDTSEVTP